MAKYEKWLKEENLLLLEGWARDGLTDAEMADEIGIGTTTLYNWRRKYEKFREATEAKKEIFDNKVVNAFLTRVLGFEYEEVQETVEDNNGVIKRKRVVTKKTVPPDVGACIFWLKNRKRKNWRDNPSELDEELKRIQIEINKAKIELIKEPNTEYLNALIEILKSPIKQRKIE